MCCNIRTLIKSSTNNFEKDSKCNNKMNFKTKINFVKMQIEYQFIKMDPCVRLDN